MDCSPQAPLSMGFSDKNTGVGCHSLLQGIFLTQESNQHLLCLLHCKQILYCWAMGKSLGIVYATRLLSFYFLPYQEDQRLEFFSIIHTINLFTECISTDNSANTILSEISSSYNWNCLVTEQWENCSILIWIFSPAPEKKRCTKTFKMKRTVNQEK